MCHQVERAVQHALALVVPGARYAAREEGPPGTLTAFAQAKIASEPLALFKSRI